MWPCRYPFNVPLVILILNIYIYIWVCRSNFKRESQIHRQTNRLFVLHSIDIWDLEKNNVIGEMVIFVGCPLSEVILCM